MDKLIIQGRKKISGNVTVAGAKNAALPLMAASILVEGWNTFPMSRFSRIRTARLLLEHLGVEVRNGKEIQINAKGLHSHTAPYELVKTMRASILVLGPLLARLKQVKVSLPGGLRYRSPAS